MHYSEYLSKWTSSVMRRNRLWYRVVKISHRIYQIQESKEEKERVRTFDIIEGAQLYIIKRNRRYHTDTRPKQKTECVKRDPHTNAHTFTQPHKYIVDGKWREKEREREKSEWNHSRHFGRAPSVSIRPPRSLSVDWIALLTWDPPWSLVKNKTTDDMYINQDGEGETKNKLVYIYVEKCVKEKWANREEESYS